MIEQPTISKKPEHGSPKISTLLSVVTGVIFLASAVITIVLVHHNMRLQALAEAEEKTLLILDRNLALHTYFSQILKPSLFNEIAPFQSADYFDPSWMSSTYALREIGNYFSKFSSTDYYYKDAAVNARSPENEADADERAFLAELKADPQLEWRSEIRTIDGNPYLVTMRAGETLETSCLRCHSNPENAPSNLVALYGSERGFFRDKDVGSIVSVLSVRVPLAVAYAEADRVSLQLSAMLATLIGLLFVIQLWLQRRLVWQPLVVIRDKALQISNSQEHLGEEITPPFGRELSQLVGDFNVMSVQLRQYQEKLVRQERLAVLGQLAGSVSHELRNPLSVMSNAIYFLKLVQPDASAQVKEYLGIVQKEISTADKIITDLLVFSRLKSVQREPVTVAGLVGRVLERFPAPAGVTVTLDLPEDLPEVYADPQQMMQVLGNLVVNACQAMPQGGKLTILASRQEQMVAVAVTDTGTGITPEHMTMLFEPLFTTKPKGIGLGLAVCKNLAEANGGRIGVQSEPGKGSTFTLYVPIYKKPEA